MTFELLNKVLIIENDIIKISPDFVINDINQALKLIKVLDNLFKELSIISEKGFINDPDVNLPVVENIVHHLGLFKVTKYQQKFKASIVLNTLYYNLVLLVMYRIIIMINKWLDESNNSGNKKYADDIVDIRKVRNNVLRMLHPVLKDRIKNKGILVTLNSITGFDSEYDLKSSLEKTNTLLSIQLASNSYLNVKVPDVSFSALEVQDFNIKGSKLWGEGKRISQCCKSLDALVNEIRYVLFEQNDLLLNKLILKLDTLLYEGKIRSKNKLSDDNSTIYSFPKSDVTTLIKYLESYSSEDLIRDSESLNDNDHKVALRYFISILNEISGNNNVLSEKMFSSIEKSVNKPTSRISYKFNNSNNQLSISVNRVLYLCMHESSADLSMLSDFDIFKESLDIVSRSFVTIGKPITKEFSDGSVSKSRVHIRDTILIAPMGAKSLAAIGAIYGEAYHKINIDDYRQGNMSVLLKENKDLFERYAMRDSEITLKHASMMEEFYFDLGKVGVPLTISGISKAYVLKEWATNDYKGYQLNSDIMIGNLSSKLTPKSARGIELSKYIMQYVSSYRGGRNESMMYGCDIIKENSRLYIDYDMTSAYTTVMCILGHPEYQKAVRLFNKTVKEMVMTDPKQFLFNYITLDVKFEFPKGTKYPCIPTRVDEYVDIYPLEGESVITGPEYLVAISMGCDIYVKEGVLIPFKVYKSEKENKDANEDNTFDYVSPFRQIISELQQKRRAHPKKTFYNYMYKEIGNSIYGLIAMGLSGKTSYDAKTKSYLRVDGGILSNPILASYITGFCRAFIGECLNNIQLLKGSVISVTTDGFITDVVDLEKKLVELEDSKLNCLLIYKQLRKLLTITKEGEYDDSALEVKNIESKGLLTWKTRGQLGFTDSGLSAATGFQTRHYNREFLIEELGNIINNKSDKSIEYVQSGLRSATDILRYDGHVLMKYSDKKYSLEYDNKRRIVDKNPLMNLYDSVPWNNIKEYSKIRILKETVNVPIYEGYSTTPSKAYKSYLETGVRGFIKIYLNEPVRYGLPKDMFPTYKSLIDFIYEYKPAQEVKLTPKRISDLKNRNTITRAVPRTVENESFIKYVKNSIKTFNEELFFRELSSEVIRNRLKEKKESKNR